MSEPYKIPKSNFVYCLVRARFVEALSRADYDNRELNFPYRGLLGVYRKRCRDYGFSECACGCRAVDIKLGPAK